MAETRAPGYIAVDGETINRAVRTTVEGRTITYRVKVLQQPLRARACGQGAKSSADRRPVDPPPIVELKIFEGENGEAAGQDITFTMHANYFLFATLEPARHIAQGRGSGEKVIPVLTGTPIAGITYLDRPSPAGYFIFPDLSVRHEGSYRLSFSLFEGLKYPKDDDKEDGESKANPMEASHVSHRLEVKSEPFIVFSAKKFPGLTQSTDLSRTVAEQGCRVRIRRDVRMRRRETKGSAKEWDGYDDDNASVRAKMSGTPDPNAFPGPPGFADPFARPRSPSNASHHSMSRRPSLQELTYGQQHYGGTAPHTPQNGFTQSAPYGPSPSTQYPPPYASQQPGMQPPPPQYQAPTYPPPSGPMQAQPQPSYYGHAPSMSYAPGTSAPYGASSPAFENGPTGRRLSDYASQVPHDHRRSSAHSIPPPPPQASNGYAHQPVYSNPLQHAQQSYSQAPAAPQPSYAPSNGTHFDSYPTRPAPIEPRASGTTTPLSARHALALPPINTAINSTARIEASSPLSAAPVSGLFSSAQTPLDSHKRSYANVFSDRYQKKPLRQGARPSVSGGSSTAVAVDRPAHELSGISAADDDEASNGDDADQFGMDYRRANGRTMRRTLPARH